MSQPLHVMLFCAAGEDASPLLDILTAGGFTPQPVTVHTLAAFKRAFEDGRCELVLSSDHVAEDDTFEALAFVQRRQTNVPFIYVVEGPDRERTVHALKAGAHDVISRERLWRMLPAVERELQQAALRREREQADEKLRVRARQQEVVAELGLKALTSEDLTELLGDSMRAVTETLEVEFAALLEPHPARDEFLVRAGAGWRPGVVGRPTARLTTPDGQSGFVRQTPASLGDLMFGAGLDCPAMLLEHGAVDGVSVIVRGPDGPAGILGAYCSQPRSFSRDDVHFLQAVANVLAGAIMRSAAEEDLVRTQIRLQNVQKMEAIGRLAGGIAHDFNNLTQAIGGISEKLLEKFDEGSPHRPVLLEIREWVDRAAVLTRQLLAFSRQQVLQPKVLNLNGVVANMEPLLRTLVGAHVTLRLTPDPKLWWIKADAAQLEQVLMNLAVNAKDAMPGGGTLTISTANVELTETDRYAPFAVTAGPYAHLLVSDTGCGMDAATKARVFEPFFTTKEHGKGTGLGLSTVYGIVKQSGGYIWIDSEPGRGSHVRIYLPRVAAPEQVPAPEPRRPAAYTLPATGTETLLLVEDEDGVRELFREWLEARGYRVLTAANGREALGVSAGHGGPIDLMIADVVMPHMGGPELARRICEHRPAMRVIYVSGYADETLGDRRVLETSAAFLQKPFTLDGLVRKVREILDQPVGAF